MRRDSRFRTARAMAYTPMLRECSGARDDPPARRLAQRRGAAWMNPWFTSPPLADLEPVDRLIDAANLELSEEDISTIEGEH